MNKSLTRERARSVVATPQQKLRDAKRAFLAGATLLRDAVSMGAMSEHTRECILDDARRADRLADQAMLDVILVNQDQSSLRARRPRKAA